jgi:hypothetical protein
MLAPGHHNFQRVAAAQASAAARRNCLRHVRTSGGQVWELERGRASASAPLRARGSAIVPARFRVSVTVGPEPVNFQLTARQSNAVTH